MLLSRRQSGLDILLEGQWSVTVTHNLILRSQFRYRFNWESLMRCLVGTGDGGVLSDAHRFKLEVPDHMNQRICAKRKVPDRLPKIK